MTEDWRAALGALRDTLPEGEEHVAETPEATARRTETLHVVTERKQRRGKTATIVEGFECDDEELKEIAAGMKQKLGTGGSARGGEILIQGDRKADVIAFLKGLGYKVKG